MLWCRYRPKAIGDTMVKTRRLMHSENCPKCKSASCVVEKLLLIGAKSPNAELAGYQRLDQLAVDELQVQYQSADPLRQFIKGCYCNHCSIGFVPTYFIKPSVLRR